MDISCALSNTPAAPWVEALQRQLPQARVHEWAPGDPPADYAVVRAPPQRFFDEQTNLRGIFNLGAGVDALASLTLPAQVPLIRIEDGGMAVQMAEYVCHMAIRHFRQFDAVQTQMRNRQWQTWPLSERSAFPIGVMGLGVLGQRVLHTLASFEFPLRGWSRTPKTLPGVECFHGDDELGKFLVGTRILVCLLPLTHSTQGLMCESNLARLLPQAYVINVGRGPQLVERDLLTLLQSGHLAGAALDVFQQEPLPDDHPFWTHPAITLTPHLSALNDLQATVKQISDKLERLERGEAVSGVVNKMLGY